MEVGSQPQPSRGGGGGGGNRVGVECDGDEERARRGEDGGAVGCKR